MNDPVSVCTLAFSTFTIISGSLVTCLPRELNAQAVSVHGTVLCPEQGRMDLTRPAANLVVVPVAPKGFADRADFTSDIGYYQLNLFWNEIRQVNLTLKYVGKSADSEYQTRFIGEEQYDRRKGVEFNMTVKQSCDSIEPSSPELALRTRDSIRAQRAGVFPAGEISSGLALTSSVISRLLLLASELGPESIPDTTLATRQQIRVGRFLSYAHSALSQNLGFSVTPFRSWDEAVFSNPSALGAIAPPPSSIQIATGKRFLRGSTILPLNNRAGLGAGVYWLRQREDRGARVNGVEYEEEFPVDEIEATVVGYASLSTAISVGLSMEYIHQSFTVPTAFQVDSFIRDTLRRRGVDLGLSLSAHPAHHVALGLALGQVLGTRVRFSEGEERSLRTLDVGVAYLNGRLNLGVDGRFSEGAGSVLGVGLNYVPLSHTVIVLGASSAYRTRTIGLRYRNFFYSFEWSNAFKKLDEGPPKRVIPDRVTHVVGGRFDL